MDYISRYWCSCKFTTGICRYSAIEKLKSQNCGMLKKLYTEILWNNLISLISSTISKFEKKNETTTIKEMILWISKAFKRLYQGKLTKYCNKLSNKFHSKFRNQNQIQGFSRFLLKIFVFFSLSEINKPNKPEQAYKLKWAFYK